MGLRLDLNCAVLSSPDAAIASLANEPNLLTVGATTGAQSILSGTTVKSIKGATGITLTSDSNVVIVTGPGSTRKRNSLIVGTAAGAEPILSGTTVKGVKGGTGIGLTSDSNVVTVACPDLSTKQNTVSAGTTWRKQYCQEQQ